ncbi:MAG: mismatch repair protein MutT [Candidatus Saccharibacteria bacterium]|nr:mismatch repair protein MutT [Candidatus Saccharibacteria bacterium]
MSGTTNIPVVSVIIRKDNKVLLIHRSGTGYMDGYYCGPGGHVEDHESFAQAAQREVKEEIGISVTPEQLSFTCMLHENYIDADVRVAAVFEITQWQGEPYNAEPEKHDDMGWFALDELPENLVPTYITALQNLDKGNGYAEYGWQSELTT